MERYIERRKKFSALLPENSMAIIFSGKELMLSNDESYPFMVDKNFLYLTGIDRDNLILKIIKYNGIVSESLYIKAYDPILAKWNGAMIKADEAKAISGIEMILDLNRFEQDFGSYYTNIIRVNEDFKLYLDLYRYHFDDEGKEGFKFASKIKNNYPHLVIKDLMSMIQSLRWIKNSDEVEDTIKAIKITKQGIEAMMDYIKPKVNERELSGVFEFNLAKNLSTNAFKSICASGLRATILHYNDNNQIVNDGELFLCDLGATYNHYKADISRVFPVNGKFSPRQKEIYNLVLNAQKLVEKNAKAGVRMSFLQKLVVDYYQQELPKINLNKDVSEYYFHGIGHQLGLDTHDLSVRKDTILKAGMIITNEPGLYIEDEAIGIRIEDDLLITENGCINLSSDIIKEVEDIENYMAKR